MKVSGSVVAQPRFPVWLMAAVLALVTMALYWPATGYEFINFDDPEYVAANPHVQGGLTWENIWWALTTVGIGMWHPLTWISHMLDCQWFGLRPGWHHLTSVVLHAANSALLLVVLRGMTGALWRSAVVAALFALHPLHVESVAWVAERKDVLSTFFVMLTLWAYHRYTQLQSLKSEGSLESGVQSLKSKVQSPSHLAHLPASIFYLVSLFCFALGLMSKPMIVTLPLVLLLLDYWPLGRMPNAAASDPQHAPRSTLHASRFTLRLLPLLVEKLPFVVLACLTGLITLHSGQAVGSLPSAAVFPMPGRVANAILWYGGYFLHAFWPVNLAVFYPLRITLSAWAVAGSASLFVGISVVALCLARQRPYVIVGWLWYLATLVPVIGLIQLGGYSHADRYTYVPLIGVFMGLTWGACEVTRRWRYQVLALAAAGGVAGVLCLALTRQQISSWKDSEALYRHALEATRNNQFAHKVLGDALDKKGQTDEAIRQYREALRLKPDYAEAHSNLGILLDKQGQTDEAIRQFQEALRRQPDLAATHYNLGVALGKQGQIDAAISQYQEALRLKPEDAIAHNNLGNALGKKGQIDEAIRQFQGAIRLKADKADYHYNLGLALARKSQTDEAIRQFRDAIRLQPDHAEAHNDLGIALSGIGQKAEAIAQFREAIRLKPDFAEACNNLGITLSRTGRMEEAIGQFQDALRLQPDYALAHFNLGGAFDQKGQMDDALLHFQEAVRLKPDDVNAHNSLGSLLIRKGQTDEAIRQFQEALRLKSDSAIAHNGLGIALGRKGQIEEAILQFQEALRLKPDYAGARKNLDALLAARAPGPPPPGAATNP